MRRQVEAWAGDDAEPYAEVVITPPDQTFDDQADLLLGGRRVELRYLGRGHTDNDIAVSIPDAGIVFAGDIIEESAPPSFDDSFPLEWPDQVAGLERLIGGPVVPGHGATVDTTFVHAQQQQLAAAARLALERHAAGMTIPQAAASGGPFPQDTLLVAFARAWPSLEISG